MPLVYITQETKDVMDVHKALVKGHYITNALFLDSAVRSRIRGMGGNAGDEHIVAHLEKLATRKARHLDVLSVKRMMERHKRRIAMARRRLDEI